MNNPFDAVMTFHSDWFHQSRTLDRPITGINIHMLTMETPWAMIGIAIPHDQYPAIPTSKILRSLNKCLTHNAGWENRTPVYCLGSNCSTTEPIPLIIEANQQLSATMSYW